jgi:general nucleoside transport system ATP-binding protein
VIVAPDQPTARPVPLVEMRQITKRFGRVTANDQVSLKVFPGEVRALLGENGAGKTTLMNILYGLYKADSGEVIIRGDRVNIRSPKDSIALKIAMVHQHFELVTTLTVAENIALGLKARREPMLDLEAVTARIGELAQEYGLSVNPGAKVEELSVGERQRAEIIKALYRDPQLLILDEPTSVLTPQESEGLFRFIRSMASERRAVIVITHKLPEVMQVSDSVTVLRHGAVVANLETSRTTIDELAEKMVGREMPNEAKADLGPAVGKGVVLEVRGISAFNDKGSLALDGVSLSVRGGEILGIAGVAGNGQTELEEVLAGMRKVTGGSIHVEGKDVTNASPRDLIEMGVGCIPEDRMGTALVLDMSIAENLVIETRNDPRFRNGSLTNSEGIKANARKLVEQYSIACGGIEAPARTLSGGNMQKLVLARVLSRRPRILVAAQPTAGLDVGAASFITEKIREQRRQGVGILLISGDLNEITALSDRVACIYNGRIMGILAAEKVEMKELGLMMGGVERP